MNFLPPNKFTFSYFPKSLSKLFLFKHHPIKLSSFQNRDFSTCRKMFLLRFNDNFFSQYYLITILQYYPFILLQYYPTELLFIHHIVLINYRNTQLLQYLVITNLTYLNIMCICCHSIEIFNFYDYIHLQYYDNLISNQHKLLITLVMEIFK